MKKLIILIPALVLVGITGFLAWDYRSQAQEQSLDVASLDHSAHAPEALGFGAYLKNLPERYFGDGAPKSVEDAIHLRDTLRGVDLKSYLPEPNEEVLVGWQRLDWNENFLHAFGAPDGAEKYGMEKVGRDLAIYIKGKSTLYARVEYNEPTELLAKRLRQGYWVVETDRDLTTLQEAMPRLNYLWTNIYESSKGDSVKYGKAKEHFATIQGVHFLKVEPKNKHRDDKMKYVMGSLGGGVVIKVRAFSSYGKIKELLEGIDFQSLNQLQTLPSPLVAEGLGPFNITTPDAWLEKYAPKPEMAARGEHASPSENHQEKFSGLKAILRGETPKPQTPIQEAGEPLH